MIQVGTMGQVNEYISRLPSSDVAAVAKRVQTRGRQKGLMVGGDGGPKPIPVAMMMHPVDPKRIETFKRGYAATLAAFSKIEEAALSGWHPYLYWLLRSGVPSGMDWELMRMETVRRKKGYIGRYGRFDALNKAIEYNCNASQGWAYHDMLCELYPETMLMLFPKLGSISLKSRMVLPKTLKLLTTAYKIERGSSQKPVIGIVMWEGDNAVEQKEVPYIAKQYRRLGYSVVVGTHKQVAVKGDRMFLNGKEIHIFNRAFAIGSRTRSNWEDAKGCYQVLSHPDTFTVVPAPRDSLSGLKSLFALVSSPATQLMYAGDGGAVSDVIPWSRFMRPWYLPIAWLGQPLLVAKKFGGTSGKQVRIGKNNLAIGDQRVFFPPTWWLWTAWGSLRGDMLIQKLDSHMGVEWPVWTQETGLQFTRYLTDVNLHTINNSVPGSAIVRFAPKHPMNVFLGGGVSLPINEGLLLRAIR